jgi:hypothetical protein
VASATLALERLRYHVWRLLNTERVVRDPITALATQRRHRLRDSAGRTSLEHRSMKQFMSMGKRFSYITGSCWVWGISIF